MRIPLYHVNAFTQKPFSGNPAAVCPLKDFLDDGWLRKVAAENNLSETAFFVPKGDLYELRWFTPRCEVSLCGHATLASSYVLLNMLQTGLSEVRFQTRFSGLLTVTQDGDLFSMNFPAMLAKRCDHPPEPLLHALGAVKSPTCILEANETYIVIYGQIRDVQNVSPDFALLEKLHPYAVAVTAPGKESDFVSRYFAPSYGIPEDPVTGSVHCALAPYWAKRLDKSQLYARQLSERGGELWCETAGTRVIIRGSAVLTVQGFLQI